MTKYLFCIVLIPKKRLVKALVILLLPVSSELMPFPTREILPLPSGFLSSVLYSIYVLVLGPQRFLLTIFDADALLLDVPDFLLSDYFDKKMDDTHWH